jgi:hypothetical protein
MEYEARPKDDLTRQALAGDRLALDELLRRARADGEETAKRRHEMALQTARWVVAALELLADRVALQHATCRATARCLCAL